MLYLLKEALKGKTLVRSMMNRMLSSYTLTGTVLDLGGGERPSYFKHFQKEQGTEIITADNDELQKDHVHIDFEKESLSYADRSFDTVLAINLLEHIYNHKHVTCEAHRVLKEGGMLIGFVPFMVNVHRDPHDYFRYTDEALHTILVHSGFPEVKIVPVGLGPFALFYNSLVSILSARYLFWMIPLIVLLDTLLLKLRPNLTERFPLGYLFEAIK